MARAWDTERVNILGVGVSAVSMETAPALIDAWIERREREYVCVFAVHSIMECQRSDGLRRIANGAGMVTPDGMPLVWLVRAGGHPRASRVYGPDLMLAVLEGSVPRGHRHLFYGGAPGVGRRLAARMTERFPGLQVVGSIEPLFGSVEELCTERVADEINAARPDVVWIGLGTPKQDQWAGRMRPLLEAPVLIGVGAAFDFHAGMVRQAPRWLQRSGLEWLFRLSVDPARLWRRYLVDNPWFVYEVCRQRAGLRRYELS